MVAIPVWPTMGVVCNVQRRLLKSNASLCSSFKNFPCGSTTSGLKVCLFHLALLILDSKTNVIVTDPDPLYSNYSLLRSRMMQNGRDR